MRILHVASGDLWAGAEVSIGHIVRETNMRKGHDVRAILLNEGTLADTLRAAGVRTDVLPEAERGFVEIARSVSAIARQFDADVIHTHRYKENVLGAWAAARAGSIHVRTAHGLQPARDWTSARTTIGAWADAAVADWAGSTWIAVSESLARSLRGVRRGVYVVPNGIPTAAPASARDELLDACGAGDALLVGFVGRLEHVKRPDRFLRLVSRLPGRVVGRPVAAVIVGAGSLESAVAAQAAALTSGPKLALVRPVPHGDRLVAGLDILVIPSDSEGLPMVMLEAMRSGVAVAGTSVGGLPEALGSCRWLVPPDAESLLADRIAELLASDESRKEWGAAIRRTFLERYAIESTVDRLLEIYATESGVRRGHR